MAFATFADLFRSPFSPGDISPCSPHRHRSSAVADDRSQTGICFLETRRRAGYHEPRAVGAADVSPALQRWESAPIHFLEIKYAAKPRSNPALRPTGYSPIDPVNAPVSHLPTSQVGHKDHGTLADRSLPNPNGKESFRHLPQRQTKSPENGPGAVQSLLKKRIPMRSPVP
jgi:hypothetical protein